MIPAPNLETISLSIFLKSKLDDNKIQNLKPFHKNRFDGLKSIDLRTDILKQEIIKYMS